MNKLLKQNVNNDISKDPPILGPLVTSSDAYFGAHISLVLAVTV